MGWQIPRLGPRSEHSFSDHAGPKHAARLIRGVIDLRFHPPKADINRTRGLLGDGSRRSRQGNPNFLEFARLRIDLDRAGMLLDDDISSWLGRTGCPPSA